MLLPIGIALPHVTVNNMRMFYEDIGNPDRMPVFLLHGFTGTGVRDWGQHFSSFGERYRVLVPDLRGHGRTDNPAGAEAMTLKQFAVDIMAFCHALKIERAAFCGHSAGSMLQLTLALLAPRLVAACILCSAGYFLSEEVRDWMRNQTPESLAEGDDPVNIEAYRASHVAQPDQWRTVQLAWLAMGEHAHADDYPEPDDLRKISAPTLIVSGDRDEYFPVEIGSHLYRTLASTEFCVLPNTGHNIPTERAAWVDLIAFDFLRRKYES